MKKCISILLICISIQLYSQKVGTGFDFTVGLLLESGMKKFSDYKGKPTAVMSDAYFSQYESNLLLENFKYCLITEYPAGKMLFFTGIFIQTNNRKKALQYYDFLVGRVDTVKLKCCTLKSEPGIDLENEKSTYFKPFARPKEYANMHLKVAFESTEQKKGKFIYNVILYIYPNPK